MRPIGYTTKVITAAFMIIAICAGDFAFAGEAGQEEKIVKITAKRFEYNPSEIRLKKGVPVVFELTSLDRLHGFNCPELGIRGDINPGKITKISLTPQKTGTFVFFCDIYCGEGHENMNGKIIVEE